MLGTHVLVTVCEAAGEPVPPQEIGARTVPVLGVIATQTTRAVGLSFAALTNVTRPLGAVTMTLVTLTVLRYASEVERAARATGPAVDRQT